MACARQSREPMFSEVPEVCQRTLAACGTSLLGAMPIGNASHPTHQLPGSEPRVRKSASPARGLSRDQAIQVDTTGSV
jgi:hypothetical protein